MSKNVIVGQSGGPTAVINSSLAGVYKTARSLGADKVYGMKYGIEGLLKEELVDLDILLDDRMSIELLKRTPSSFLGSCRYKLPDPEQDTTPYVQLFTLFDKYDICAVFYIGGNDSMDTIAKLSRYGQRMGSDVRFIGVPKTIDNDLCLTDHTPGYGSAAKYIATHPEGSHPGFLGLQHPQRHRGRDHGPARRLAGRRRLPGCRRGLRRSRYDPAARGPLQPGAVFEKGR